MRLRGRVIGALNLFRMGPGALGPADAATGQALADVATIALLQSWALRDVQAVAEQLEEALNSRTAVEQAKGVLAQRLGIGMDEAFSRLRGFARARRRHLTDVALEVVAGTLSPDQVRVAPRVTPLSRAQRLFEVLRGGSGSPTALPRTPAVSCPARTRSEKADGSGAGANAASPCRVPDFGSALSKSPRVARESPSGSVSGGRRPE